jgi:hypothetical protein
MGSVMSLLTLAHSLGMLAGALLAGCAMDWFELTWAFPVGAGIMAAGMAGFRLGVRADTLPTLTGAPDQIRGTDQSD